MSRGSSAALICAQCGASLAESSRFCGSCGTATLATATVNTQAPSVPAPAPDMTGREIAGRYRVLAKLGEGGMGAVYRAEQISLKRKVAIKLLKPELSSQPGLVRRFNAEAELAAKLNHPNTVNIYDFGQDTDGTLFIAMEHVEGKSLRQVLAAEGAMQAPRALNIVAQIASSLTDAHAHGIVHRDLKPDNVMLSERGKHKDVVRVLDFGIAKLRDDGASVEQAMTRAGDLVGTPQYMAPEQIRAEAVDGRTDVYAVGSMLYEMVTGRLPFEGPTLMAILSKHLTEPAEPPSKRRPDLRISPVIDQLVLETLAKEPSARTPSMERLGERVLEVAAQLGAIVAFGPGVGPSTAQVGPGGPAYVGGQGAGTGSGAGPASGLGPRPPTYPPPMTPGRVMRPPGVPHTYPPGAMQAPPEPIVATAPSTSPTTPVPLSPPTPPPPGPSYPSPYPPPAVSPYAPPGYAPPGYAGPQAAPLPSGTPPPPAHIPTPAPMPVVAARPRKTSKAVILALALVAMAGAGVAVFLIVRGGGKPKPADTTPGSGTAAEAAARAADPWAATDAPDAAPFTSTVTQEGTIDPWKDGTVVTTRLGSKLTLPDGMVPGRIQVPDGSFYFIGNYQGAPVRVLLIEAADDPKHRGYEELANSITRTSKVVRTSTQYVGGQTMNTVIVTDTDLDQVTPVEAEMMFYSDGNRVVALIVATSPEAFEDFATIRTQFFSRRFQP